jgi:hypothetical protein
MFLFRYLRYLSTQHNWFFGGSSHTSQIFSYNLNDSVAIVIGRCFLVISAAGRDI